MPGTRKAYRIARSAPDNQPRKCHLAKIARMEFNHPMPTFLFVVPLLLLCGAVCGCATRSPEPTSRNALRAPIRAYILPNGRAKLFDESMTIPKLVRRLRREKDGRAIVLHAETGVSSAQLVRMRQQLVEAGVPNVSIVTAREATVETADDAITPGDFSRTAPAHPSPSPPRIRRR